ncbi:hypothetical protein [Mariniluteicoccus flavus]
MTVRPTSPRSLVVASLAAVAMGLATMSTAIAAPTPAPSATATATAKPSTTRPKASFAITVQAPRTATSPAVVVVTGARPGSQVEASAGVLDQVQAEATGSAKADSSGRATIVLKPNGSWTAGARYHVGAYEPDAVGGSAQSSFIAPGAKKQTSTPSTTAPKSDRGGLAKTGV